MTIYRPKGSPFYHFDFVHRGARFHGSTKQSERRAAERIEREERERAKAAAWAAAGFERATKLIQELSDAELHKRGGAKSHHGSLMPAAPSSGAQGTG
jgi:hypothetical protein